MSDFYKSDSKLWSGLQLLQNGSSANGSFLSWKFPRLFYIQGSVIGIFQIWRSTRLLFTTEECHWPPPYRGGDILGLYTREGPEVALHLPKCLKPLIPRTPEATSRPTSAPSFARSTVPVKRRGVGYYKTNRFETAIKSEDAFTSGTDSDCTPNKQGGRGTELLRCWLWVHYFYQDAATSGGGGDPWSLCSQCRRWNWSS